MKYVIKWFIPYWKKHKLRLFVIIFLGLCVSFLSALSPYYIKKIINGFEKNLSRDYLIRNVWIIFSISIIHYILNVVATVERAYMNYRIEYEVRKKLFSHILSLDEYIFTKYSQGDILTRLVDDISEKIAWFSCSGVFRFIQAVFTIIAVLFFMFYTNFKLAVVSILPLPLLLYITTHFRSIISKKFELLQKSISEIYNFLEISLSGIRVIKANSKEKNFVKKFDELNLVQMEKSIDAEKKQVLMRYLFFAIATLSVIMVYFFGGISAISRGDITIGDIVSFQVYTFMLIFPVSDVSQFFVSGHRAKTSIKRIDEIFNFKPSLILPNKPLKLSNSIEKIVLKDLSLKINENYVLKKINLEIERGKKIAVVGKIGSSKTILLKTISRLIEFTDGIFTVNSIDVRNIDLDDYYSKIVYISQEPYIISDTILNNITLYKSYEKSEISKVIEICQLEKDISTMPKGLDTIIGNKGMSISGGQRQRISLARSLLKRPEIIIMDDSTNQMDLNTEKNFWDLFFKEFKDITLIYVTHRIRSIEKSDFVVVMDRGEIVEMGRHVDLIDRNELYVKIYHQFRMEEDNGNK
jgi:ATP-binding cassette subfamily B multidrug efflux pump